MRISIAFVVLAATSCLWPATAARAADPPGRITGIGGVFVVSKNPKALAAWYRDVLGISLEPWGGATFRYDATGHPPVMVWNAFPEGAGYLAPSRREFMLDFAVDDLDAFIPRLESKRVTILKRGLGPQRQVRLDSGPGRYENRAVAAGEALTKKGREN